MSQPQRVTVMTRQGCHLCDEALTTVHAVAREVGAEVTVSDVDTDERLKSRYGQRVPVILVGETEIAEYRVSADALRAALNPNLPLWRRLFTR